MVEDGAVSGANPVPHKQTYQHSTSLEPRDLPYKTPHISLHKPLHGEIYIYIKKKKNNLCFNNYHQRAGSSTTWNSHQKWCQVPWPSPSFHSLGYLLLTHLFHLLLLGLNLAKFALGLERLSFALPTTKSSLLGSSPHECFVIATKLSLWLESNLSLINGFSMGFEVGVLGVGVGDGDGKVEVHYSLWNCWCRWRWQSNGRRIHYQLLSSLQNIAGNMHVCGL